MNNKANYMDPRSAIPVELNFYDSKNNVLDPSALTFKIVYLDRKKTRYEIEHKVGTEDQSEYFKNCYISDGRLFIRFENTGFASGKLERELWLINKVTSDRGENFRTGELKYIRTELSCIEIISGSQPCSLQRNLIIPDCITLLETITLPCIEYYGLKTPQSEIIVNDFINNKKEVADAINDKGGEASETDSMNVLADKIRELVPAEPVFQTSGNLNPKWHDLPKIAGENYLTEIPHMWIILISKSVHNMELSGAQRYLCSDGFYTEQSQSHEFIETDDDYDTRWVIFYGQEPQYNFRSSLNGKAFSLLFYNVNPSGVRINNLGVSTILQFIQYDNLSIDASGWGQGNNISSVSFDKVQNIILPQNCFNGLTNLYSFPLPEGVRNIYINNGAFSGSAIKRFSTPENIESLTVSASFSSSRIEEFIVKDAPDAAISIGSGNAYVFNASNIQRVSIAKVRNLYMGQYTFYLAGMMQSLHIESPVESLSISFMVGLNIPLITLDGDWNYSVNFTNVTTQTTGSMYQNVQALSDRTGQTPLTLTFGAAKLNTLLAAYPDAAEIASSKNWNLA